MRAAVTPQVDPLARDADAREEGSDQLLSRADEREDGPVVVGVGVHVEQARVLPERRPDRLDDGGVAPFGEVRHRFERPHRNYSTSR